jgi:hypothetical protein
MEPLTNALADFGESVSATFAENPILILAALGLMAAIWALQSRLSKPNDNGQG